MCCAADYPNYKCHTCAKEFLDSNFNQAVIDKILNFTKLPQIPHIHRNGNFSSIFAFFF